MSEGEMVLQALDDLPDEVLLRVLAGAGSKAILRAAACSRRLHALAKVLQSYRCFSAAASTQPELDAALAEACERALQGMLGCVDFALLFVTHHEKLQGGLASKVVEGLLPRLPPGTPVVGCATAGLMGVGPEGAFELDPDPSSGGGGAAPDGGVALLLGRMPGCTVRPFCNLPPPPPPLQQQGQQRQQGQPSGRPAAGSRKTDAANAAVVDWLDAHATHAATAAAEGGGGGGGSRRRRGSGGAAGAKDAAGSAAATAATAAAAAAAAPSVRLSARDLGLQSVWVLMAGSNAAFALLDGPGGLLRWLQADERARPVIAGGVSSGRGDLFFHPGRRQQTPPPATEAAAAVATATAKAGEAEADVTAAGGAGGGSGGGRRSRRSSRSGTAVAAAAAAAADVWDATVKGIQYVGLAVMAGESTVHAAAAAGGGGSLIPEASDDDGIPAAAAATGGGSSETGGGGGAAAAAATAAGGEPATPAAAAAATVSEAAVPAAVRACALAMRGCSGLPGQAVYERVDVSRESMTELRRRHAGAEGEDSDDFDESDEDEEGEVVTVSGGTSPGTTSLLQELRAVVVRTHSLPQLAVWLAERGEASRHSGLDVQVFRSGKMVVGKVEPQLLAMYGIVAFCTTDVAALDAIMAGAAAAAATGCVVCCQLAGITPQGCRLHLQAELPVLRSVASPYPLLPGGRPDPRSWEGYDAVRRGALAAGARAGPVGLAVFSCTGRGRAIFGEGSTEGEARIADEVLQQGVPFVGAYCDGELGPFVRHGYAGWFFNPLCVQPPDAATAAVAAAAATMMTTATTAVAASGGEAAAAPEGRCGSSGRGGGAAEERHMVVVAGGGRVLPLDRTVMQGYTSVYAALG